MSVVPASKTDSILGSVGFRQGTTSIHTSRTMMFAELSLLLEEVPPHSRAIDYQTAIVQENVLGKPTQTTRQRTAKRLAELYALDPRCTVFRLLRHYWSSGSSSRPMLAFLIAASRDPLLRETTPWLLLTPHGEPVTAKAIGDELTAKYPLRFKATTLRSTAQNLASSWTQAGYLRGKVNKIRSKAVASPIIAAFALVLGYLCGLRGKPLLDSPWTRLLERSPAELTNLVIEASRQGWLNYKAAGSVVEITFPGLLRHQEEKAAHD